MKGTKFVVESGDGPNSVALLEGSVAVRHQESGKAALLGRGQATDITGTGDLAVRRLTREESEYSKVFDEGEFEFTPVRIDRNSIPESDSILLNAKLEKFEGFSSMGIRGEFQKYEPPPHNRNPIQFRLSFEPKRLKPSPERVIGYLGTCRTSTVPKELRFYTRLYNKGFELGSNHRITTLRGTMKAGKWQTHFIPIQSREAISDAEFESWTKDGNGLFECNYYPSLESLNQAPNPPFIMEVASIQFVTLGEKK